ncbi:MAG: hypothetical protein ACREL3_00830 [Gemmatimonadales bacterium]
MTPKTKALPEDPGAPLRYKLEEARTMVTRLGSENVAAIQGEESALERGDTGSTVAARSRALGVADALARYRVTRSLSSRPGSRRWRR